MSRQKSEAWRRTAEAAHDLVTAHCRDTGDTQQILADELGVSMTLLNNWINGHHPLPMDVAVRLSTLTGRDDLIRVFASLTNHIAIPMPQPGEWPNTADVLKETGDVLRAYGESVADGVITAAESERIINEIEEAQGALESMKERVKAAPARAPKPRSVM